jgi:SRSO17 transposase
MDQVALDCDHLLGGSPDTGLIIDETGIPKKGKKSVGTARQWCGRLGKVDNCQVGVFAGPSAALVDGRLFLPKEWTDNRKRCRDAGVPDEVVFKTKSQLALEIVHHARSQGIRFAWIGVDGGYGKEPDFLSTLDDEGEQFVADVQKDQSIYLEDPAPYVPARRTSKGRTPSRYITDVPKITVEAWAAGQPEEAWQRIAAKEN